MNDESKKPCEFHQGLVDKFEKLITGLAALEASLPGKLDAITKEFKFVGSEMNRRTEVLFKLCENLDKRVDEHDRCIIHLQNDVRQIKESGMSGKSESPEESHEVEQRVSLLENWKIKLGAYAACVLFLFQTGVTIWSLFKK